MLLYVSQATTCLQQLYQSNCLKNICSFGWMLLLALSTNSTDSEEHTQIAVAMQVFANNLVNPSTKL